MRILPRALSLLLMLAVLATAARADTIIFPSQARRYADRQVTVRGVIAHVRDQGSVVWLDFGGKAPNRLSLAVYPSAVTAFNDSATLMSKTVDVTGTVRLKSGQPWIEVRAPSQLFVKD